MSAIQFEGDINRVHYLAPNGGLVAQWITRLTTDQKIPGSNPGELDYLFFILKQAQHKESNYLDLVSKEFLLMMARINLTSVKI